MLGLWAAAASAVAAQPPAMLIDEDQADELPAVVVTEQREPKRKALSIDETLPISSVDSARLERRQASTVFDVLDEVPGISVNGGARSSGMSFNIRGYSDSEDIAVKVDGVPKGFEKYRFGGTFIEPDLLKSVEVRRGVQIESGVGALGGTVSAQTKDAADFLRPGQSWGARVRAGYANNNEEQSRHVAMYARPSDRLDLLAALSKRKSHDIALPNGERLALSAADADSQLIKASWFPHDDWTWTGSWLQYNDQGLQAYDATGGQPGLFGSTQRRISDSTVSVMAKWAPMHERYEWQMTLGHAQTRVRDSFDPNAFFSIFANASTGVVNDDIHMRGNTIDTSGRWRVLEQRTLSDGQTNMQLDLRLGVQLSQQQRQSSRRQALNPDRYPGGYNPAQPSGAKHLGGIYIQPDWQIGRWQILPGVRWDEVRIAAEGPAVDVLTSAGQASRATYSRTSPSLMVNYDLVPKRWKVFAQYAQSFRPPLMDELFSQGAFGNCGVASTLSPPPSTGICSDLYDIEKSRNVEWGVSTRQANFLGTSRHLQAKVTLFRNRTEQLLESITAKPNTVGLTMQPGWERRHGAELEASLESERQFVTLSYSRTRGQLFAGGQDDVIEGLASVPGDQLHLSLGWRWSDLEAVVRWKKVSPRWVVTGTQNQKNVYGMQAGYALLGASLQWRITPYLDIALSGENLTNQTYTLNGGFGNSEGPQAAGRNIRMALTARY